MKKSVYWPPKPAVPVEKPLTWDELGRRVWAARGLVELAAHENERLWYAIPQKMRKQ